MYHWHAVKWEFLEAQQDQGGHILITKVTSSTVCVLAGVSLRMPVQRLKQRQSTGKESSMLSHMEITSNHVIFKQIFRRSQAASWRVKNSTRLYMQLRPIPKQYFISSANVSFCLFELEAKNHLCNTPPGEGARHVLRKILNPVDVFSFLLVFLFLLCTNQK